MNLDILLHGIVLKLLKTGGRKGLVFMGKFTALHTVLNRNSERKKAEIVHRPQLITFTTCLYGLVRRAESSNWPQEFCSPECKVLMGEAQIGKVSCYCCAFTWLILPFFSDICHGVNVCGGIPTVFNVVCSAHGNFPFCWTLLLVGYYEDDFLLKSAV